jgi:hypothetical protein
MWVNSWCWLLYGLTIANDPVIIAPNALGVLFSSIQMLLFVVYGMPGAVRPTKLVSV